MREIAFFIPDFNGGGAERALLTLLGHWPDAGQRSARPVLLVRRRTGSLAREVPEWLETISLGLPRSGLRSTLGTVAALATTLRQRRPAALVTFLSLPSVAAANRLSGRPAKLVASFQSAPCSPRSDPSLGGLVDSSLTKPVHSWAYGQVDLALPIAPGIACECIEKLGIPSHKVSVLPNPVDLNRVWACMDEPVEHEVFSDPSIPVLVSAGRLVYEKGFDVLLRAASTLAPDTNFRVAILGDGGLREELGQLAATLGIADRVYFLGFQSNPWKYMRKAAVFVLPSRFEGLGNVIVEAMACGAPVVAARAPFGPEYVVTHGASGLLVPVEDSRALAAEIERILTEPDTRRRLVAGGSARCRDFDVPVVFDAFWRQMLRVTDVPRA